MCGDSTRRHSSCDEPILVSTQWHPYHFQSRVRCRCRKVRFFPRWRNFHARLRFRHTIRPFLVTRTRVTCSLSCGHTIGSKTLRKSTLFTNAGARHYRSPLYRGQNLLFHVLNWRSFLSSGNSNHSSFSFALLHGTSNWHMRAE